MHDQRFATAPLVLVGLTLLAASCTSDADGSPAGGDAPVVQLGGPGGTNRELTDEEVEAIETPSYTEADVAFAQQMIPHHEQALVLTALVDARTASADLPKMAERMAISQRDEIAQLETWLSARGETVPAADHDRHSSEHAELMPGMLTGAELAQLEAARGQEFDRLFLQYMIRHHEGAVIMVQDLLNRHGGGQEPAIFQLAQHIESDQQIEISRMKHVLVEM